MDFIKGFTKKNMALNKRRTIVTMIGVMLSCALICAVVGMAGSFWESLKQNEIQTNGRFHAEFMQVAKSDLPLISENVNIKKSGTVTRLGCVPVRHTGVKTDYYSSLYSFDADAFDMIAHEIGSGRLPENEQEILVPESLGLSIGEKTELEIGDLDEDTETVFTSREKRSYTVVGILDSISSWISGFRGPDSCLITFGAAEENGFTNVFVECYKPQAAYLHCYQISQQLEKNEAYSGFSTSDLTKFQGGIGFTLKKTLGTLVAVILTIILVMSVLVIGNSFRISVSEKISQYGMLASIGATRRQIRRTVLLEGLYIGSLGIVSGVLLGVGVVALLVVIVNLLMSDVVNLNLVFSLPWWVIPITVLVSALTVYLSCLLPSVQAARISPIEAIRGNNETGKGLSRRRVRTGKLVHKLFGVGGVIALKNLKRSRRKYRTTVISLVVGVSVFIGLSSFIDLGFGLVNTQYARADYSISINPRETGYTDQSKQLLELYQKIGKLELTDRIWYYGEYPLLVPAAEYASADMQKYMENWNPPEEEAMCSMELLILDRDNFAEYASRAGVKNADLSKAAILADEYLAEEGEQTHRIRIYKTREGETIKACEVDERNDTTYSFTITRVTDVFPPGYERVYSPGGLMIVSEDYFKTTPRTILNTAYIETDNPGRLVTDIEILAEEAGLSGEIYINNISSEAEGVHRLLITVSIFLYGFIIVITLIGVTNVINTVTTNMNLRAPEFAMLKSVGMTGHEFNRMIRLESLMYGSKSLLIGIPIGIALSVWISHSFSYAYVEAYKLPVAAILECIVFVAVIVGFTMKYAVGKINRQNIIETIRKQNI